MPGSATSFLTARLLLPDDLVRGQVNLLSCPIWQDAALVAPSSGTITIYDGSGVAQVSAAAVSIVGNIATYSYTPGSTLTLGEGWRVEWSLVIAGLTHTFRNSGSLCRMPLHPVLTDADLYRVNRGLDPTSSGRLSDRADWQDQIDEAWVRIYGRVCAAGQRPYLIAEPWSLREPHMLLTMALIYEDFATRLPETQWAEQAKNYLDRFESAWGRLTFRYDSVDSIGSAEARRRPASPPIFLTGRF